MGKLIDPAKTLSWRRPYHGSAHIIWHRALNLQLPNSNSAAPRRKREHEYSHCVKYQYKDIGAVCFWFSSPYCNHKVTEAGLSELISDNQRPVTSDVHGCPWLFDFAGTKALFLSSTSIIKGIMESTVLTSPWVNKCDSIPISNPQHSDRSDGVPDSVSMHQQRCPWQFNCQEDMLMKHRGFLLTFFRIPFNPCFQV